MKQIIDQLKAEALASGHALSRSEQRVIDRVSKRLHVSRDTQQDYADSMSFGERLADRIAAFGGSWTFILIFLGLLVAWVIVNTVILANIGKPFDPYPFVFLNLSMLAAIQAPVIMMSQNRQSTKDRAAAEHDYEVNLKAELEILALHQKVDTLRDQQWLELVEMQRQQIALLTRIVDGGGSSTPAHSA